MLKKTTRSQTLSFRTTQLNYSLIHHYSRLQGIPPSTVIALALDDWLINNHEKYIKTIEEKQKQQEYIKNSMVNLVSCDRPQRLTHSLDTTEK